MSQSFVALATWRRDCDRNGGFEDKLIDCVSNLCKSDSKFSLSLAKKSGTQLTVEGNVTIENCLIGVSRGYDSPGGISRNPGILLDLVVIKLFDRKEKSDVWNFFRCWEI